MQICNTKQASTACTVGWLWVPKHLLAALFLVSLPAHSLLSLWMGSRAALNNQTSSPNPFGGQLLTAKVPLQNFQFAVQARGESVMGTEIRMEGGKMGVSPGTRAQHLLQKASQATAWSLMKSRRLLCLFNICLHVPFPCFICPRKASSQARNLITVLLKSMSGKKKKPPERMTKFLSFPAVSTRSGFSLILIPALCSPPGAQGTVNVNLSLFLLQLKSYLFFQSEIRLSSCFFPTKKGVN